jgi:hypothetical protein
MYSSIINEKSDVLKFLHGSRYISLEIVTIIYSSGVAAFGISIEIYLFVPYVIVNCILVARNCHSGQEMITAILWIVKIICLFVAIELCYRNLRKLPNYETNFNSSARTMLRQALLFTVTMLFLCSPGLRALYDTINRDLPNLCTYATAQCGVTDLYQPTFSYNNEKCLEDLTAYVSGREQLRVLRNFILLNRVSYSVFNENFLEINNDVKHVFLRILLVFLYLILATSVLISYIDPFIFINHCRLAYNIIECVIFLLLLWLPAYNLYDMRHRLPSRTTQSREHASSMNTSPIILLAV